MLLATVKVPEIEAVPETSSFAVGAVVPTPTLPSLLITTALSYVPA